MRSVKPRAPGSSTSRPAAVKRTSRSAKRRTCVPIAPLDESGTFLTGFGPSKDDPPSIPMQSTRCWRISSKKGCSWRSSAIRTTTPTAGAVRPSCYSGSWTSGSSTCAGAMRSSKIATTSAGFRSMACKREIDWLKNMGDWMISKKRYLGTRPADLGLRELRGVRGHGRARGAKEPGDCRLERF